MSLYEVPITKLSGIGNERAKLFHKMDIYTVGELIEFYPRQYEDWTTPQSIDKAQDGQRMLFKAYVSSPVKTVRISNGRLLTRTTISDESGSINVIFFNNRYIDSMLKENEEYYFNGRVSMDHTQYQLVSPEFSKTASSDSIVPVYNLTAGLSNRIVVKAMKEALNMLPSTIKDTLPSYILERFDLCSLEYAIRNIHFPSNFAAQVRAKNRLVFEELLTLNLGMRLLKSRNREETAISMPIDYTNELISTLPYELTNAQSRTVNECITDMRTKKSPMNRLVQGDVGSGKTAVAACVAFNAVKNGYQVAFMAPTEILAEQHYSTFVSMLNSFDMNVCLLTGSVTASQKKHIKEDIKNGNIDIVIGTHALLTDDLEFSNLGCAITDEQHRFGVEQRAKLSSKGESPHVLVLSATPIPRTLGLIIYGDLDISIIDELPPGRKDVKTLLISSSKRNRALNFIKDEVLKGRQAYIVCPLVEYSEMDLEDVNSYAQDLMSGFFSDLPVGILHGKMKPKEKEKIMDAFNNNEISVLVSTTVIEVGVDVKNATIMMIENAERFGLSQLHQLRGRVGRGSDESYCILVCDKMNDITKQRLSIMVETSNGFRIADEDLKLRGPGDFFGSKQHGLPNLKIADLSDMDNLKMSQSAAQEIIKNSPDLSSDELSPLRAKIRLLYRSVTSEKLN